LKPLLTRTPGRWLVTRRLICSVGRGGAGAGLLNTATGAVFPFGDSAERFGEWQHRFGRAELGRRKVSWCDREASQPKSLCANGKTESAQSPKNSY